jgi:hypothetical protein
LMRVKGYATDVVMFCFTLTVEVSSKPEEAKWQHR